ncbi:MAG: hypothetical protein JWM86_479 [Thermoleophilia bacterium]|nr:hypothetical protein [Thermoleophilia bacterium]
MIDAIGSIRPIEGFTPVPAPAPAEPVSFDIPLTAIEPLQLPPGACTSTPCGMELIRVAVADRAVDHQAVSAEVLRHTVSAYAVYRQCRYDDAQRRR